jgi:carboxypeptidase C (cathepsin A)
MVYSNGGLHNCSYSGILPDVTEGLFFWLFRHPDPQAPFVVWFQGGPGATSMIGLFAENGPLRVNGTFGDDFNITAADKAWTDHYNVMYIDQPFGTGFSTEDPDN